MLSNVHSCLNQIADAPGRNAKIKLLTRFLKDDTFKTVVQYALNSDVVLHIKKLPPFVQTESVPGLDPVEYLFNLFDRLNEQDGANAEDKRLVHAIACTSEATYEVVKRILNKDLKCGVQTKSINAAIPDTIYYVPYCRCSTDTEEDKFWAKKGVKYAQLKEDGMFVNIAHADGGICFTTRNGKPVLQLNRLGSTLTSVRTTNTMYTGELVVVRNGKVLDRQTGNGILGSLMQGTASQEDADSVAVRLWDAIPIEDFWLYKCNIPYTKRLENLQAFVKAVGNLEVADQVYTEIVGTKEEAADFYTRMRLLDEEGSVLKLGNGLWADHTSPSMLKKKNVSTCAVRIVGWKKGKEGSKYEDVMGAVFCESECGGMKVTINGKTDEMRALDWDASIGSIWTVKFNYVTESKSNPFPSLYLPRLDKPRPDRTTADTLAVIKERAKVINE